MPSASMRWTVVRVMVVLPSPFVPALICPRPECPLELKRLAPCPVHPLHLLDRVTHGRKIWPDGLVHDCNERDDVAWRHERGGPDTFHPVFSGTSVPQRDFLLVVDPVLIIRPQAAIQNPLLKTQVALRNVFRNRIAFGRTGVPREVGDAGDDPMPVFHALPRLPSEGLTCEPQAALFRVRESGVGLQFSELSHRNGRLGNFGRSVKVSRNVLSNRFHGALSLNLPLEAGRFQRLCSSRPACLVRWHLSLDHAIRTGSSHS